MKNTKFIDRLEAIGGKLQQNRYLIAISGGLASLMPIIIVGALSVVIDQFGLQAYQDFLVKIGLKQYLGTINAVTNGMLGLYAAFSIAYNLARQYKIDGFMSGIMSVASFLLVTPFGIMKDGKTAGIATNYLGHEGIFTGIILGIIVVEISRFMKEKGFTVKMPAGVPEMVDRSFTALTSTAVVLIASLIIKIIFASTTYETFPGLITAIIQTPLSYLGGSWIALVIMMAVVNLLWWLGIHGHLVALSVLTPIYIQMDLENLQAYQAGTELPNIIGNSFIFVYASGAAVLFGLVFWLWKAKSERYNKLSKLAAIPMLFGIGEPLAYGIPYTLNPTLFIPVVFSASLNVILAYFGTLIGILPRLNGVAIQGGMPVVITGLLSGGWRVALFQIFLMFINVLVFYPFVKALDDVTYEQEQKAKEA